MAGGSSVSAIGGASLRIVGLNSML
jgi:hypothetical protein